MTLLKLCAVSDADTARMNECPVIPPVSIHYNCGIEEQKQMLTTDHGS